MNQPNQTNRTTVRLTKNEDMVLITKGGRHICVNVNLLKHALSIPYTKKDGTVKTAHDIQQDKARGLNMYFAQVQAIAEAESARECAPIIKDQI